MEVEVEESERWKKGREDFVDFFQVLSDKAGE